MREALINFRRTLSFSKMAEAYWSPGKRSTDGNKRGGEYRGILKGYTYVHHRPQVC